MPRVLEPVKEILIAQDILYASIELPYTRLLQDWDSTEKTGRDDQSVRTTHAVFFARVLSSLVSDALAAIPHNLENPNDGAGFGTKVHEEVTLRMSTLPDLRGSRMIKVVQYTGCAFGRIDVQVA